MPSQELQSAQTPDDPHRRDLSKNLENKEVTTQKLQEKAQGDFKELTLQLLAR
jgi:hypothetical protein